LVGWTVVLGSPGRFDPDEIWQLVAEQHVNSVIIVGDAMARPLMDSFSDDTDTSSLFVFGSGGAILSPATKARITEKPPSGPSLI
jgi:acyl-CoA synthetase (AMP-forming)/AMP-acid ligase II